MQNATISPVVARNRGQLRGQKPPLKLQEIWSIRVRLQLGKRVRDLALFNLAIDSKLRGCDLVAQKVHDVAPSGAVTSRAIVMQRKTQRPVRFAITDQTRGALGPGSGWRIWVSISTSFPAASRCLLTSLRANTLASSVDGWAISGKGSASIARDRTPPRLRYLDCLDGISPLAM